jgi:hypothetical protein
MTEDQQQKWLSGFQRAEAEELASLDLSPQPERDQGLADAILRRIPPEKQPPRRSSRITRRSMAGAGMTFALMATLGAYLLPRWFQSKGDPLAAYDLEIEADRQVMGSPSPNPKIVKLAPESMLHVRLTPEVDVADKVEYSAYLWRDAALIPLPIELACSPSGKLEGKKRASDLPGISDGAWTVVFVLARPGLLPSATQVKEALVSSPPTPPRPWQLRSQLIVLGR